MPKDFKDFKRVLRENREEIKLSGSSKDYWLYLAKVMGQKKASQSREKAIAQKRKIKCANPNGVVVEVEKKDLE